MTYSNSTTRRNRRTIKNRKIIKKHKTYKKGGSKNKRRHKKQIKSRRKKKQRGGDTLKKKEKIDEFCDNKSILKEAYSSCKERTLVYIEHESFTEGLETFCSITETFPQNILDEIKETHDKKTPDSYLTLAKLINTHMIKGFYAVKIDQIKEPESGTMILDKNITNPDIIKEEVDIEAIKNKKLNKTTKEGEEKRYLFNKGKGKELLLELIEELKKEGIEYLMLNPLHTEGDLLVKYYNRLGFRGPVDIKKLNKWNSYSTLRFMYAKLDDIK